MLLLRLLVWGLRAFLVGGASSRSLGCLQSRGEPLTDDRPLPPKPGRCLARCNAEAAGQHSHLWAWAACLGQCHSVAMFWRWLGCPHPVCATAWQQAPDARST